MYEKSPVSGNIYVTHPYLPDSGRESYPAHVRVSRWFSTVMIV